MILACVGTCCRKDCFNASAADYAVAITGPAQGTLYRYAGSAWQAQAGLTFAQSGLGDHTAPWYKSSGPYSPTQGSQGWSFTWPLSISDSVPVRFRARHRRGGQYGRWGVADHDRRHGCACDHGDHLHPAD